MSAGNNSGNDADPKVAGPSIRPVSVRALAGFSAKSGSLDRKFTPGPSAQEGVEGHKQVVFRREKNYQSEISLSIFYQDLLIRGRADGYDVNNNCLEEIKTFYGDFSKIPDNHRQLHWAQAKLYGWMYCNQHSLEKLTLALVYFHLGDQEEHRIELSCTATELQTYGMELAEKYWQWQQQINARLQQLTSWIDCLSFPYPELHQTQRQMAEAVYKAAATGRVLLAEAPTGTGKTLASIFPAIKAISKTAVDKIFYLTAKTTGKHLALENLQLIASDSPGTPLRVLELTAQDKICLEPDKPCAGDSCIYARDFYHKLTKARLAAYEMPMLTRQALTQLAVEYEICPYYLAMEMSRWVDIIVADFNYYFDGSSLLYGLTKELNWHPYLLVDECHNLLDRGRQMYSAELNRGDLLAAKRLAPKSIKKSLERINRSWLELSSSLTFAPDQLTLLATIPEKFTLALTGFINDYIEFLQQHPDHPAQGSPTQQFFFKAFNFQQKQDLVSEDYCIDMQSTGETKETLTLRNLIPARLLAERLALAHSACFFSATLRPAYFYRELLGLPENTVCMQVSSPFITDQLNVKITRNISTRYQHRARAIAPVCNIIKQQLLADSGNYIAYFSSYEFLQQVQQQLVTDLATLDIELITQSRSMSEKDRETFIQRFGTHQNLMGLAVLGGAFSEGIDLPGEALKGAFIVTLGLPQLNPINEHLRQCMQNLFQQGYNFTYLYPGIQKVVQAAGRVIRTRQDKGYLWLLDDRFAQAEIRDLLPDWWTIAEV